MRISCNAPESDFDTALSTAREYLTNGYYVKVLCVLRPKETGVSGMAVLDRFINDLDGDAIVYRAPTCSGRAAYMLLAPINENNRQYARYSV